MEEYLIGSIQEMSLLVKQIGPSMIIKSKNKLVSAIDKLPYPTKNKGNMFMGPLQDLLLADKLFGFVMGKNL